MRCRLGTRASRAIASRKDSTAGRTTATVLLNSSLAVRSASSSAEDDLQILRFIPKFLSFSKSTR